MATRPYPRDAPSIALAVPYFGETPNYFHLWLESCGNNSTIDWHMYLDRPLPTNTVTPSNVHIHRTSFNDFRRRIQALFDFEISLSRPYKLCDYRPVYGEALRADLGDYDFWGYCDIDTIWGNLRQFLKGPPLDRYDRIFTGGHLSLFRNTAQLRSLYRQGQNHDTLLDYRDVYTSEASFAFDEWGPNKNGMNAIALKEGIPFYLEQMPYADIQVRNYELRSNRELFTLQPQQASDERRKRNIAFSYIDGSLHQHAIDSGNGAVVTREEAYIHLQKRPMRGADRISSPGTSFVILPPNKFQQAPAKIDLDFLRNKARAHFFYPHYYRLRSKSFWHKLKSTAHRAAILPLRLMKRVRE